MLMMTGSRMEELAPMRTRFRFFSLLYDTPVCHLCCLPASCMFRICGVRFDGNKTVQFNWTVIQWSFIPAISHYMKQIQFLFFGFINVANCLNSR